MRETVGALFLILYGLLIGLLLAPVFGPSGADWTVLATGVRDVTATVGVVVGGAWAYGKFVRNREGEIRIHLAHEVHAIQIGERVLLRIVLELKNIGPVAAFPPSGFTFVQTPPKDTSTQHLDPHKAWDTQHQITFNFGADNLCIEPGDTVRYSRDVWLEGSAQHVQLYSRVLIGSENWHCDETSIHDIKSMAHQISKQPDAARSVAA